MCFAYACMIISLLLLRTVGWGQNGHYIAATVGRAFLNQSGRRVVERLLGPGELDLDSSLLEASVWPDRISRNPAYLWTAPLHYMHIPARACEWFGTENEARLISSGASNIIGGISKFVEVVLDEVADAKQREEGLKFLIHLLSDLNQPLHVGRREDKGGSRLIVTPPWDHEFSKSGKTVPAPRPRHLHSLWDTHILEYTYASLGLDWNRLAEKLISDIRAGLYANSYPLLGGDLVGNAVTRAQESSRLAKRAAYSHEGRPILNFDKLPKTYYEHSSQVILQQLAKSGLDIAHTLNLIGEKLYRETGTESG